MSACLISPIDGTPALSAERRAFRCLISRIGLVVGIILGLTVSISGAAVEGASFPGWRTFSDSIMPVPNIQRAALTPRERNEVVHFSVALKMRNFDALEARISRGEHIARADMEANYLPDVAEYANVKAWLISQGFRITQGDVAHTNIFAAGSVEQISRSFGVTFARVATDDGEFTSAITAPSLPESVSGSVLSINGLQPHIRMHRNRISRPPVIPVSGYGTLIAPDDILAAYNVPSTLTGSGQTIAIITGSTVLDSDLTLFYTAVGSPQEVGNITAILVNGGPTAASQLEDASEDTMDLEWAGSIAPAARIRSYATPDNETQYILNACSQILADAATNHITVVSMSYADLESNYSAATLQSYSQGFAQLAAAGITALASSGDGGSNPNTDGTLGYNASNPLQPEYPASDPNVCGVGATTVTLTSGSFSYVGESAWISSYGGATYLSGGGVSSVFSRPQWQTDSGPVLTNSHRCVPDVAAVSIGQIGSDSTYPFGVLNGAEQDFGGGTSLSCPIWAGIITDLNQGRADNGLSSIGLLGPALYPLEGTTSFRDVATGNNGAYSAGIGYDLCTGLGTPNVSDLFSALATYTSGRAPTITSQPKSITVAIGSSFSLSVTAVGTATLTYQWYYNGSPITGQTAPTYSNGNAQANNAGSYTVTVSNSFGIATSSGATVTVNVPVTPPPGGSGGSGGGGAPSYWFFCALAPLVLARIGVQMRRVARL